MRLGFAALAIAVIVGLLVVRLRAHSTRRRDARVDGVYDRIERIRRERRRGRP